MQKHRYTKSNLKLINGISPSARRQTATGVLVALGLLIGSCGGGSSGGGGDNPQPDMPDPVPDPIVDATSTEDLRTNASVNIGSSLDSTLDGVSGVTSGGDSTGAVDDSATTGVGGIWSDDAQSLIDTSLSLGTDDTTMRDGSTITIDPDDAAVCAEEIVDMAGNDAEFQRCQALVSDMIVQLDATSDTAGTVTYFFRQQPLVVIGYTDMSNSFELNLGTLKTLADADNALNPDFVDDNQLDTVQGAIRVFAEATNTIVGSEAGTVSLAVTQPVALASADAATAFSLGNGTLFSLAADAANDSASIELGVGALQINSEPDDTPLGIELAGLTVFIETTSDAEQLTVQNLGIGDGPLRVSLDNSELLNMSLDTFGFTVSEDGDNITLNGGLNLSLLVRELFDDETVSDTLFTLLEMTAPAGTQVSNQLNGSQMVVSGGPLNYSLTGQDEFGNTLTDEVSVSAGQCVEDVADFTTELDSDFEIVSCQ